jgi:hypothetical protein
MHCHSQRYEVWLNAVIMIVMLVALVAGCGRAYAQSADDSTADATRAVIVDVPDPTGATDDPTIAHRIDDSVAGVSDSSAVEPGASAGSVRADEPSGSESEDGAVLEIPRVIDLANGNRVDRPTEGASANVDGNDDDTTQSGQDNQDLAADDDLAPADDQVGTLEDYENQAGAAPMGPIFFGPGIAIVRFPHPPPLNPRAWPPFGSPMASSPIILPPTSSGPFPSTSPMLMAPRPFGSFPGGGLMGLHR